MHTGTKTIVLAAAVGGGADTVAFLARRLHLLRESPTRAGFILFGVGVWGALAGSAAPEPRPGRRTLAFASATGLMNGLLLFAHLRRGLRNPDVFVGPAFAAASVAGAAVGLATAPRRRTGWRARLARAAGRG